MALDPRPLTDSLASARAAAAKDGEHKYVAAVAAARTDVDVAALYSDDGAVSLVWEQPDRGVAVAGRDAVHTVVAPDSAERFREMNRSAGALFRRMQTVHVDRSPLEPVLVGGASFDPGTAWPWGSGRMILPEVTYLRRDGRAAWIRVTEVGPDTDPAAEAEATVRELARLAPLGGGWLPPSELAPSGPFAPADADYPKLVQQALEEIARGALDKVVVARAATLRHPVDVRATLATLRHRYPGCATFAFRIDDEVFVGASPELLARVHSGRVETAAVAGTAPRGSDFETDHALGSELLEDPKERREHDMVYREIRRRLEAAGVVVDEVRSPEILKLPGLQHLWTRITGAAPAGTSLLEVVGHLHPTPAVAGLPVDDATTWLRAHEGLDRGWYSGPIGYVDAAGDGEFRVGLRSARVAGDEVTLFGGAGVVVGSDPDRELAETELKFQAVGRVLRGTG